MVKFPSLAFDNATASVKPGIEALYQPHIGIGHGEIGVGGAVNVDAELAPNFAIDKITGEIYMKLSFVIFGRTTLDEKFLIINGTIYQRTAQGMMRALSDLDAGQPLPGFDGWTVYQAKQVSSLTISRNYLKAGPEGFAVASTGARTKSLLSTGGVALSPLDAFRLMKQPVATKTGFATLGKGGSNPPQLAQAELQIITNAFPYSEPTLARVRDRS